MPTKGSEVGHELKATDLRPGSIVCIAPPGRDDMLITMHVVEVRSSLRGDNLVVFYSGVLKWHVVNLISGDNLKDDQGRIVRVFEYLSEP